MIDELRTEIKQLSISERILLAEDIWDSIAEENESFQLTPVQKDELEKEANPLT
jgi:putative addiction module component (TIGR02574 family)